MISIIRMRNIADQSCRENQNTYLILIFFPKNRSGYEIIENICGAREATDVTRRKGEICVPDNVGKNTDT